MKIGRYQIDILHEGTMLVDGGITFSGMPRSEWEKFAPADAGNRIRIGLNQLLIRGNGINMLIDAGLGNKIRPAKKRIMGIENAVGICENLAKFNLKPEDITHIIFSHLHFDHCGGATKVEGEDIVPVFTNAIHYIQKEEWNTACNPDDISRTSYCPHDFLPLLHSEKLKLISGNREIVDGIFVEVSGGHTLAHQIVRIEDELHTCIYPADICPTPFHGKVGRREAFDIYPAQTLAARGNFLQQAAKPSCLVVFSHSFEPSFFKYNPADTSFSRL